MQFIEVERPTHAELSDELLVLDSIAHWERMLHTGPDTGYEPKEYPTAAYCPLCQVYLDNFCYDEGEECGDCPIALNVGLPCCEETPYSAAYNAWSRGDCYDEKFKAQIMFLRNLWNENYWRSK